MEMTDLAKILKKSKYNKSVDSNNFTMIELSKISGIKLNTLNGIFFNRKIPDGDTLVLLGKVLDIPPLDILHAAKKITQDMEKEIFLHKEDLAELYQNTYGISCDEYPYDIINELQDISDRNKKVTDENSSPIQGVAAIGGLNHG